ncbi:MAG TPA: glycine cleavage system aminomethyltransferase GcvT [Chloroflexota bacterium]
MSSELRTPLAAVHEALGARMVPFSGWLMPVQYTSIVAEHLHTRTSASLFDLSHMGRLRISGSGAQALLQHATTNDVSRLAEGGAQYTLACNEDGGIIEDLIVYRFADSWQLIVNAANRVRILGHLESLRDRHEYYARIEDETFATALIGLQGPLSQEILQPLVDSDLTDLGYYHARAALLSLAPGARPHPNPLPGGEAVPALISRTGYTGEDGFELGLDADEAEMIWQALLDDPRVQPAGLGARDTLRLEAGMALYGHELTEDINPYQAGLQRVVKLAKGDFVGRRALETLSRSPPTRSLIGLEFERGAVPRAGYTVHQGGQVVGEVASGTFSPTLNRPIATAYVQAPTPEPGVELAVSIRNGLVPARVVSLPFVPHHTKSAGLGRQGRQPEG